MVKRKINTVVGVRLSLGSFNYCIPGLVENRELLRKRMNGLGILHEIFVVLKDYSIIYRVKCICILTRYALIFHVQPPTRQNTIKIWEPVRRGDSRRLLGNQCKTAVKFDLNKFRNLSRKIAHRHSSHNAKLAPNSKIFVILRFSVCFQWNTCSYRTTGREIRFDRMTSYAYTTAALRTKGLSNTR